MRYFVIAGLLFLFIDMAFGYMIASHIGDVVIPAFQVIAEELSNR